MDNKKEPEFMREIWKKTEQEMEEQQQKVKRTVDEYLRYRIGKEDDAEWDVETVAQQLACLHEGLIEWAGLVDEDLFLMLYLVTRAETCIVRVNDQTGEYESALFALGWEDGIAVMADTNDKSIMAGVKGKLLARRKLPYADLIHQKTKELFEEMRGVVQMEKIVVPTGATGTVLFENVFDNN